MNHGCERERERGREREGRERGGEGGPGERMNHGYFVIVS